MVRTRGRGYTLAALAKALGESVQSVKRLSKEEREQLMVLLLKNKTRYSSKSCALPDLSHIEHINFNLVYLTGWLNN